MRFLPVVLLAVLAFAPPAQAGTTPSCSVRGSETVAKNRAVRVYTRAVNRGDETQRLYACTYSDGRKLLLDRASDDFVSTSVEFKQVDLTGRFVAWEHVLTDFSCHAACPPEYDQVQESILVANIRTRKRTRLEGTPRAGTLAVNSRGRVTWIDDASGEQRSGSAR